MEVTCGRVERGCKVVKEEIGRESKARIRKIKQWKVTAGDRRTGREEHGGDMGG